MTVMEQITALINQADQAITEERFDDLMDFYTEDAVLIVRPGVEVHGRAAIREAFIKIAAYFKHSLKPVQGKRLFLEAGDTVLVLAQTFIEADNKTDSAYDYERHATYVYRRVNGRWLCAIDNSYGTTLLRSE